MKTFFETLGYIAFFIIGVAVLFLLSIFLEIEAERLLS